MSTDDEAPPTSGETADRIRVVLRPMGTPLPLGFIGLFFGTAAFSALQLGWVADDQEKIIAAAVLAFSVPVQLIACVFGIMARDPIAGTGMGILTGTWAMIGVSTLLGAPGTTSPGLGVLLILTALVILIPAAAGAAKKLAAGVMVLGSVRYILTGIAEISGVSEMMAVAGWAGIALAAVAFYAALGFSLEDAHHRPVIPVFRAGGAPGGDLHEETSQLEREAGIRSEL